MPYNESSYENAILEIFCTKLGYTHIYAPNLTRDYTEPLYMDELLPALRRINPKLPEAAIYEAVNKLRGFEGGSILQRNDEFRADCEGDL